MSNKFNYTIFSQPEQIENDISIAVDFRAKAETIIGIGSFDDLEMYFTLGSGKGNLIVTKVIYDELNYSVECYSDIRLTQVIPVISNLYASASAITFIAIDDFTYFDFESLMVNNSMIGENTPLDLQFSDAVNSQSQIAIDFPVVLIFSINTISKFDLQSVEVFTEKLNVVLKPNDELRLDSDNYTLTLNGENILHLYEGDFLNLSRDLIRMNVSVGTSGEIDGKLFFEELWI